MMATGSTPSKTTVSPRNGMGYLFTIIFAALSLLAVYMLQIASVKSGVSDKMEHITTINRFTEHPLPLRTTYTGIAPLDKGLSFLVAAFMNGAAGWDKGFFVFMMYFLFSFFPIIAIWAIESCRERNGLALTRLSVLYSRVFVVGLELTNEDSTSIYALFYQTVGGAIIVPIYYLAYLYDTSSIQYWTKPRHVRLPYAKALLPSLVIGYLIPTTLMFLPYSASNLWTTQAMVAFWQPCPWYVDALLWSLSRVYSNIGSQPHVGLKQERASTHQDIRYLNLVYTVSFVVAALSHIALVLTCLLSSDPQHSFQHMFLPPSPGDVQASLVQGIHGIFQADFWIIFTASVVWAYLAIWDLKRVGLKRDVSLGMALVWVALGCVALGPAATVTVIWWWREGVMAKGERR